MDTTTEQTDPKDDNDKFGTYRDAFEIYENGKHRRYTLLFSVNGAVAAIAKLYPSTGLDRLSRMNRNQEGFNVRRP